MDVAGPMIHIALLVLLALATLVGIAAFWNPAPAAPLSERERVGKHRHPDDQDTTRLDDIWPPRPIR